MSRFVIEILQGVALGMVIGFLIIFYCERSKNLFWLGFLYGLYYPWRIFTDFKGKKREQWVKERMKRHV